MEWRFEEARCLQVGDIDGKRLMVHVHRVKGAKDATFRSRGRRYAGCVVTGARIEIRDGLRRGGFYES